MTTPLNAPIILEICVDSVESAIAAQRGGAHRLELCADLLEGGVTPSHGMIATVRSRISIPLHVLIRPRAGDFLYTADEFEIMRRDLLAAQQLGADGIVVGILNQDGTVDRGRTRELVEIARPMKVTFHRAFDMTNDLSRALEDIVLLGIERILTSGGARTAEAGTAIIAALTRQAGDRTAIMAGSGITPSNVSGIIAATGVREIHATARVQVTSHMQHRNDTISMGAMKSKEDEYERFVASRELISQLLAASISAPAAAS